jgi:FkbM family methyltransferase
MTPRIVPFVFNWKDQFDNAKRIEDELRMTFDNVIVINSDDHHTREGWVDIGDECYFKAQFFKALELFEGDILFHIQADASYHDWPAVVASALESFQAHRWGVFAPNVDFTPWPSQRTDIELDWSREPNLRLVNCTDCTCWFIHRDIVEQFQERAAIFSANKFGMGIDLTMSALSYLNRRPVIRDYTHTVAHPRRRGYDNDAAKFELAAYVDTISEDLRPILEYILKDKQRLAGLLQPPAAQNGLEFEIYVKKKEIEGLFFDFWIGDEAARQWYDVNSVDGWWPEMRFIRDKLLRPGDTVFECGAHHGCTTIALSRWVGPEGRIFAFEPAAYNAQMVRRNIELNGLRNVVIEQKAVGLTDGRAFISDKSNSSVLQGATAGREVDVTSLDKFAALNPDLLKIDVEGFEAEVLKGAQRVLGNSPALAIEVHPEAMQRYGTSVEQFLGLIDVGQYELFVLWSDEAEEPVPYGGEAITTRAHIFGVPRNRRAAVADEVTR